MKKRKVKFSKAQAWYAAAGTLEDTFGHWPWAPTDATEAQFEHIVKVIVPMLRRKARIVKAKERKRDR